MDWSVNQIIKAPIQSFPNRQFKLTKLLGEGAEGKVFAAESQNWNVQYCAIKIHYGQQKQDYLNFLDHTIQYQNQFERPNISNFNPSHIIRIYEKLQIGNQMVIIMELGEADLYQYINQNKNISLQVIGNYCVQMAKALQFIHLKQFMHRDIKPENYLIVGHQVKLIDFGVVKKNIDFLKTKNVGSMIFQAPEIMIGSNNYNSSVDIWSLGCVFYEMIKKTPLFECQNQQEIPYQIQNQLKQIDNKINSLQISDVWKQTIMAMLKPNPMDRPNINQILEKIEKIPIIQIQFQQQKIIQNQIIAPNNFQMNNVQNQFNKILQPQQGIENGFQQQMNKNKDIKAKLEQAQQLIQEITQSEDYIKYKKYYAEISTLKYESEIINQTLQQRYEKQQELEQLKIDIQQSQAQILKLEENQKIFCQMQLQKQILENLEEKLNQNKQQYNDYDYETMHQQNIEKEQNIKQYQEQILALQIELNRQNCLQEILIQNQEKLHELQQKQQLNENLQQKIMEQEKEIAKLEVESKVYIELENKSQIQDDQINELNKQIAKLREDSNTMVQKEQLINELKFKLSILEKDLKNVEEINNQAEELTLQLEQALQSATTIQEKIRQIEQKQAEIKDIGVKLKVEKIELDNKEQGLKIIEQSLNKLKFENEQIRNEIERKQNEQQLLLSQYVQEKEELENKLAQLQNQGQGKIKDSQFQQFQVVPQNQINQFNNQGGFNQNKNFAQNFQQAQGQKQQFNQQQQFPQQYNFQLQNK